MLLIEHAKIEHLILDLSAGERDPFIAIRFLFEEFFTGLHDFVDNVDVDLPELPAEVCVDHRIQLPQYLTQLRVEVVLYAVVGSESKR